MIFQIMGFLGTNFETTPPGPVWSAMDGLQEPKTMASRDARDGFEKGSAQNGIQNEETSQRNGWYVLVKLFLSSFYRRIKTGIDKYTRYV